MNSNRGGRDRGGRSNRFQGRNYPGNRSRGSAGFSEGLGIHPVELLIREVILVGRLQTKQRTQ